MLNDLEIVYDYVDAGFRVFPLHEIKNGECTCEDGPECQTAGKHPRVAAWQNTPQWSDEQLENMIEHMITTGVGVLVQSFLVVDVDPRNGGWEGYQKLCDKLGFDLRERSGFVVQTGGAGLHIYFRCPQGSYAQELREFEGIDFKTTGYVVGCGSMHRSGNLYEREKGGPEQVADAPPELLALLERKNHTRAVVGGFEVDVSLDDVRDMLRYHKNEDLHYEEWLRTGMAIHHSTQGSEEGRALFHVWSSQSLKHEDKKFDLSWQSFGKNHNPITLGTLIQMAEANGYTRPVVFDVAMPDIQDKGHELPFDISHCDPLKPVGVVGKIAEWIDAQSYYPRQRVSAMAAIMAVGNLAGLFWREDVTGVTTNLMALCVAGSGTGKEAQQEAFLEIMQAGLLAQCVHGDIKSKQEITRNLIEHQAAFYLTDEIGEILKTIENAKKRGGAAYLEGVTGDLLKIYTKAHSTLPVSGDVRRQMNEDLLRRIAQAEKTIEDNEGKPEPVETTVTTPSPKMAVQRAQRRLTNARELLERLAAGGLSMPFLSLMGFTTLESLEPALSVELAKNGFLNRAFIIEERETNPKPNKRFNKSPFPYGDAMKAIATGHDYDATALAGERTEYYGPHRTITTEPDAKKALGALQTWQWGYAENHKKTTGYEALVRRAYEFISKISTILAVADGGVRTLEHVIWSAAFIKWDIDEKIRLIRYVEAKDAQDTTTVADGFVDRILSMTQEPQYESVIIRNLTRRKGVNRSDIEKLLAKLEAGGALLREGARLTARKA